MTGESELVVKGRGSAVFAGTVVDDGNIVVRARRVGSDTRIRNIVKMVGESEKAKARVQGKPEHLTDVIVPFNLLAFFGVLAITRNMAKAMSVRMVDYSCAIKLSTPVAVMSALREAANRGVVVKGQVPRSHIRGRHHRLRQDGNAHDGKPDGRAGDLI